MDAPSGNDPDSDAVPKSFHGKRPRPRRRILAAAGGAAAVVVLAVVAGVALHRVNSGASSAPAAGASGTQRQSAAAAGGANVPVASNSAAGTSLAESCTGAPLKSQLAAAVRGGASVIVATGMVTGKSATGGPATAGAPARYAVTLRSVQTLRGPAVTPGSIAWTPGPAPGTPANPVNSALLAPGGRLFAIVWPKAATHDLVGPTLQLAPIVGADVVFTPYVCWNLNGLQPSQYQDSTPLRSVPGGANFGGERQAAENGLYTVPLTTVRQIAASA
jgi:hypothetical protein